MMVVRRAPGPAYANLQWRKPRDVGRGGASGAMGISSLRVCCPGALTTSVGSGRRGGELVRSIAIAGTGVAQRRLIDERVAPGVATASMDMADRGSASQGRNGMPRRTGSGHDVSILITAGRLRGEAPRRNVSMTIMRPPQQGHGCESGLGSVASAQLSTPASGCAAVTSSKRRARAILSARVPLASRP